jgi:hypothetical protein
MRRNRLALLAAAPCALVLASPHRALAVPAFASQTGQPCTACHVGAYGPFLTPFGRAFKLGGYTMTGGTGLAAKIPLSAMFYGTYTDTQKGQSAPAATHYGENGNIAVDQINVFLAGRVNDHVGGFVQGTFDGIASQLYWDNTDIRVADQGKIFGKDMVYGLSFNNAPGLSDPYNSTYPWGYPYVASALAVSPLAATLLSGSLAGNAVGLDAYAFIDDHIYVDLGLYTTMTPYLLKSLGESYGPGASTAPAPYARIAYEWDWGNNNAHVGGTVFHADFNPASGDRTAYTGVGQDSYTDWMADAEWQYIGNINTIALDGHYDYEDAHLAGTTTLGGSSMAGNSLTDARATLTYYFRNTYGLNFSWDSIWGNRNPALYAGGTPDSGSADGKPATNDLTLEADWVPFGKSSSFLAPFANLKLGVQYTIYTKFNGAPQNYDGYGRSAADNNTLFVFAWTVF